MNWQRFIAICQSNSKIKSHFLGTNISSINPKIKHCPSEMVSAIEKLLQRSNINIGKHSLELLYVYVCVRFELKAFLPPVSIYIFPFSMHMNPFVYWCMCMMLRCYDGEQTKEFVVPCE